MPLSAKEAEPEVDLQALLNEVYGRASLDLAIDYAKLPVPNLATEDAS